MHSFFLFSDDTSADIITSDADGVAAGLDVSPADCRVLPRLGLADRISTLKASSSVMPAFQRTDGVFDGS